jgi:hypothetical protein
MDMATIGWMRCSHLSMCSYTCSCSLMFRASGLSSHMGLGLCEGVYDYVSRGVGDHWIDRVDVRAQLDGWRVWLLCDG